MSDTIANPLNKPIKKTAPQTLPILYSFRRCPYAMGARLGLAFAGESYEIREIILRRKPAEMLSISPKGNVPVLKLMDGSVLDDSVDIVLWALDQKYPDGWAPLTTEQKQAADTLMADLEGQFLEILDKYSYPERYKTSNRSSAWKEGIKFLEKLDQALAQNEGHLCTTTPCFADILMFPFVRQFWAVDKEVFETLVKLPHLIKWLTFFLEHPLFKKTMKKYNPWLETRKTSKAPVEVLFS